MMYSDIAEGVDMAELADLADQARSDLHEKFPRLFQTPLEGHKENPVAEVARFGKGKDLLLHEIVDLQQKAASTINIPFSGGLRSCKVLLTDGDNSAVYRVIEALATIQFHYYNYDPDLCYCVKVFFMTICFDLVRHAKDKTLTSEVIDVCLWKIDEKVEHLRSHLS